jgi:ubiquinone/menaquinone biosynthesis C-methylase UbiE
MQFSNPDENIREFGLKDGQKVAIFGSGSGGHTLASARAMKGTGTIYGIDSRAHSLEKLSKEVADRHFLNVRIKGGNVERVGGTGITSNSTDAVLIPDTLFSASSKTGVFKEAERILSFGGRLLVVDWIASFGGAGPQPEHVYTEEEAMKDAKTAGFIYDRRFSAGSYHYALIFHKPRPDEVRKVKSP